MERPEQVEQPKSQVHETSARLFEAAMSADDPASRVRNNVTKEARSIADLFDYDKTKGQSFEKMEEGANRLSNDLKAVASDTNTYNRLLKEVAKDINAIPPRELPMTPEVKLSDIDPKTGTYKNAYIWINADSWDSHEAYRIVQPGNTLSQIAADSYAELTKVYDGESPRMSKSEYLQGIIKRNHITDPNKIKVGQVLNMSDF